MLASQWWLTVLAFFLTVSAALIGGWLQHRSWKRRTLEKKRDEYKASSIETLDELSRLADHRLYRQRLFLWHIDGHPELRDRTRNEYSEALRTWNDNLGRMKSKLWVSFGMGVVLEFEEVVHKAFEQTGALIEKMHKNGSTPAEKSVCDRALNDLGKGVYTFVVRCLKMVERDEIYDLKKSSVVSHKNWDSLSTSFLVKRLFGLAQKP